jgi:orotate phosphoribosyltransferase
MPQQTITAHEHEFLKFAIDSGVLLFGKFTLKSGRVSPYFFDAGLFNTGALLARLARFYATTLAVAEPEDFMLFGPAYKGIPLAAATATALAEHHDRHVPFAFNRKEAKDHGEGGQIIGAEIIGRVVIIDDVVTAGTSVGEAIEIIVSAGAQPAALVIALDREESISENGRSTVQDIRDRFGLTVHTITRFSKLIEYLRNDPDLGNQVSALEAYRDRYGMVFE